MEDRESRLLQGLFQLLPHPDHVEAAVRGPAVAAGDVLLARRHGVGLAAVGVDDEDLGALLLRKGGGEGSVEDGGVKFPVGAVVDVHVPCNHVALRRGGHQGPGGDAVVGEEEGRLRLGRVLLDGAGLFGIGPDGLLGALGVPAVVGLLRQQHRTLADGQGQGGWDGVLPPAVPQLAAEEGHGQIAPGPQGLQGSLGGGAGGGGGDQVEDEGGRRCRRRFSPPARPGTALDGHIAVLLCEACTGAAGPGSPPRL